MGKFWRRAVCRYSNGTLGVVRVNQVTRNGAKNALTAESARIPQLTLGNILVTFPTDVKYSRENIDWDGGPALWRLSQRKFS